MDRIKASILAERKQKTNQLSTTHTLTPKQYLTIAVWLFETFKSFEVIHNNDGSSETVKLTIGI